MRLSAEVPPVDLTLSRARLVGADMVAAPGVKLGRLLYTSPVGLIAVYVAPRGTQFPKLTVRDVQDHSFMAENTARDVGLYGWKRGKIGFGLTLPQPLNSATSQNFAVDAQRATDAPGR